MRARIGRWLRAWADRIDRQGEGARAYPEPDFVDRHANPSLFGLEARGAASSRRTARQFREAYDRPEHMTCGQQSPRGTIRPPVITTQQEVPPPTSVHHCCGRCDAGQ